MINQKGPCANCKVEIEKQIAKKNLEDIERISKCFNCSKRVNSYMRIITWRWHPIEEEVDMTLCPLCAKKVVKLLKTYPEKLKDN